MPSIDIYLAKQSEPVRRVLEALRRTIQAAAPEAEESFSYGMPAFRIRGRPLVAFGASAGHCALYPMNPATIDSYRHLLGGFDTSKGTIRFDVNRPLPARVVSTLVTARLRDLAGSPTAGGPRSAGRPTTAGIRPPAMPRQVRSYFAGLSACARRHMQTLRGAIRAAAPSAAEGFGYGMPAFKLGGKGLVWYAAWKEHTSLYPVSTNTTRELGEALEGYATSGKGTVRFPLDKPVPTTLVRQLVRARVAEIRKEQEHGRPSRGNPAA